MKLPLRIPFVVQVSPSQVVAAAHLDSLVRRAIAMGAEEFQGQLIPAGQSDHSKSGRHGV